MKTTRFFLFLTVIVMMTVGCAGVQYQKETQLSNGAILVQGGRTGLFGTDNSFMQVIPAEGAPVQKVNLKKTYTRSTSSWTGCADQGWKPNKRAKNIKRSELKEEINEEVLYGADQQGQTTFWAGGNSSTGNILAPALSVAAGMVGAAAAHRPDSYNSTTNTNNSSTGGRTNVRTGDTTLTGGATNVKVSGVGQGGAGGIGNGGQGGAGGIGNGGQGGAGGNSDSTSSSVNTNTNSAQGDAAAAAAASSAAAAAAE